MNTLYSPYIQDILPAFYESEGGIGKITVPFSLPIGVDVSEISGFALKIKTVQNGTILDTIQSFSYNMNKQEAYFYWSIPTVVKVGQYFKVQLAFLGINNELGFFSTTSLIKYTSKPYINLLDTDGVIFPYQECKGIYKPTEDLGEKAKYYIFKLFDKDFQEVENSGWLIHKNNSLDEETIDTYTFFTELIDNEQYYISYGVETINKLIIYTRLVPCMKIQEVNTNMDFKEQLETCLTGYNDADNGYIHLYFDMTQSVGNIQIIEPKEFILYRTDNRSNFKQLRKMAIFVFYSAGKLNNWEFNDFLVEQGITYRYLLQQVNKNNIYSKFIQIGNDITVDFEDMFLFDGKKQLKIKYNPKVSSFKTTFVETKVNTIGSKYPFILRSGQAEYKEFPIAGLLSYYMDNEELFIKKEELFLEKDNHIRTFSAVEDHTYSGPHDTTNLPHYLIDKTTIQTDTEMQKIETTNLVGYNILAERLFKLACLDWLNEHKVLLFKSPTEGNYLIKVMNVSLTPEDNLGRMLHSFTSSAVEIDDYSYQSLIKYGFINLNVPFKTNTNYLYESVEFTDEKSGTANIGKINKHAIYEYLNIDGVLPLSQVQIGSTNVTIGATGSLTLKKNKQTLPDVYITKPIHGTLTYQYKDISLNKDTTFNTLDNVKFYNKIFTLNGAATLDYSDAPLQLKYFSLLAEPKEIITIYQDNLTNSYYYARTGSDPDYEYFNRVKHFNPIAIYRIIVGLSSQYRAYKNGSWTSVTSPFDYSICYNEEDILHPVSSINILDTPRFSFDATDFTLNNLKIGNGLICHCIMYYSEVILREVE